MHPPAAGMYGPILRQLRDSKGRSQADVARSVGISPAQLARLETSQRRLTVEDFVAIAEALGERPGNLLPNDLGELGRLKPLIDRLIAISGNHLEHVAKILDEILLLTGNADARPARARPGRITARKARG